MSIFLDLLNDGAFAAIAAIGFASISNPKRSTFWSLGLLAALGHITRFVLMHYCDVHLSLASFAGGLIIGTLSIPMATVVNSPAETLSFPALLPMVPGKFAYGSIQALVECMSHRTEEDHLSQPRTGDAAQSARRIEGNGPTQRDATLIFCPDAWNLDNFVTS